jgi:molecular chaperone Hsp33
VSAGVPATSGASLVRAISADRTVRALVAVTTPVVEEARRRHGTFPTATAALGRVLTGALLLAATLKRDERLGLELVGDGPLRGVLADATPAGDVRGFALRPFTHLEPRNGKLDVGGALGAGRLCVTRVPLAGGDLYRSIVPLVSGEVGQDLAHYLVTSEQVPSVVGLGVFVDREGQVMGAGGYLLQTLPDASERTLDTLAASVEAAPSPSAMVRQGLDPAAIAELLLGDLGTTVLQRSPVRFRCRCSPERVGTAILAMGRKEIEDILREDGHVEAVCEFCGERYRVEEDEVRALLVGA